MPVVCGLSWPCHLQPVTRLKRVGAEGVVSGGKERSPLYVKSQGERLSISTWGPTAGCRTPGLAPSGISGPLSGHWPSGRLCRLLLPPELQLSVLSKQWLALRSEVPRTVRHLMLSKPN